MRVKELQNVARRETPIEYRRTFTATAVLETPHHAAPSPTRIEFVIEISPMGDRSVRVKLLDEIEFPLVPALEALKEHITVLERAGDLP